MKFLKKTDKFKMQAAIKIEYKNGTQRVILAQIDGAGIVENEDEDRIFLTTLEEQDLSLFKRYTNHLGAKVYNLKGDINKVSLTLIGYSEASEKMLIAYIKKVALLSYSNKLLHFVLFCNLKENSNYDEFIKDNGYIINVKD